MATFTAEDGQADDAANRPNTVNYIEIAVKDLVATKKFFSSVFGWSFTDYGPAYASFSRRDAGIDGGFYVSAEATPRPPPGSQAPVLVVLYAEDLEGLRARVRASSGRLAERGIFDFPGGRRFHFFDPSGNEYAAWST